MDRKDTFSSESSSMHGLIILETSVINALCSQDQIGVLHVATTYQTPENLMVCLPVNHVRAHKVILTELIDAASTR